MDESSGSMLMRITKEFKFEMAHALFGYDGPCRHIHGHSYRLLVTLIGAIHREDGPKKGMVFDFSDLKRIVNSKIIEVFDHSLVLNKSVSSELTLVVQGYNVIFTDFQPTCEELCAHFSGILLANLPERVRLHHVELHETATSYASWYAADNEMNNNVELM